MVTIKISTANEAFDVPGPEIARILRKLANVVGNYPGVPVPGEIYFRDINGNTVGNFKYREE